MGLYTEFFRIIVQEKYSLAIGEMVGNVIKIDLMTYKGARGYLRNGGSFGGGGYSCRHARGEHETDGVGLGC
ncbi:hypothetical protein PVK06_020298 [Gossypium arboreum]|uniref:Uncharacterized protein n=1 Tax=Gossypium arboreum TaxID=29729 RepID=A0ABR0PMG1_GOSAR|nr:hypothetical protein PVK06_020298 [Gossypium arboreum]